MVQENKQKYKASLESSQADNTQVSQANLTYLFIYLFNTIFIYLFIFCTAHVCTVNEIDFSHACLMLVLLNDDFQKNDFGKWRTLTAFCVKII